MYLPNFGVNTFLDDETLYTLFYLLSKMRVTSAQALRYHENRSEN